MQKGQINPLYNTVHAPKNVFTMWDGEKLFYVVLQIAYSIICLLSCKILEYITYILLKFSYNVTISSLMWKTQLCCI